MTLQLGDICIFALRKNNEDGDDEKKDHAFRGFVETLYRDGWGIRPLTAQVASVAPKKLSFDRVEKVTILYRAPKSRRGYIAMRRIAVGQWWRLVEREDDAAAAAAVEGKVVDIHHDVMEIEILPSREHREYDFAYKGLHESLGIVRMTPIHNDLEKEEEEEKEDDMDLNEWVKRTPHPPQDLSLLLPTTTTTTWPQQKHTMDNNHDNVPPWILPMVKPAAAAAAAVVAAVTMDDDEEDDEEEEDDDGEKQEVPFMFSQQEYQRPRIHQGDWVWVLPGKGGLVDYAAVAATTTATVTPFTLVTDINEAILRMNISLATLATATATATATTISHKGGIKEDETLWEMDWNPSRHIFDKAYCRGITPVRILEWMQSSLRVPFGCATVSNIMRSTLALRWQRQRQQQQQQQQLPTIEFVEQCTQWIEKVWWRTAWKYHQQRVRWCRDYMDALYERQWLKKERSKSFHQLRRERETNTASAATTTAAEFHHAPSFLETFGWFGRDDQFHLCEMYDAAAAATATATATAAIPWSDSEQMWKWYQQDQGEMLAMYLQMYVLERKPPLLSAKSIAESLVEWDKQQTLERASKRKPMLAKRFASMEDWTKAVANHAVSKQMSFDADLDPLFPMYGVVKKEYKQYVENTRRKNGAIATVMSLALYLEQIRHLSKELAAEMETTILHTKRCRRALKIGDYVEIMDHGRRIRKQLKDEQGNWQDMVVITEDGEHRFEDDNTEKEPAEQKSVEDVSPEEKVAVLSTRAVELMKTTRVEHDEKMVDVANRLSNIQYRQKKHQWMLQQPQQQQQQQLIEPSLPSSSLDATTSEERMDQDEIRWILGRTCEQERWMRLYLLGRCRLKSGQWIRQEEEDGKWFVSTQSWIRMLSVPLWYYAGTFLSTSPSLLPSSPPPPQWFAIQKTVNGQKWVIEKESGVVLYQMAVEAVEVVAATEDETKTSTITSSPTPIPTPTATEQRILSQCYELLTWIENKQHIFCAEAAAAAAATAAAAAPAMVKLSGSLSDIKRRVNTMIQNPVVHHMRMLYQTGEDEREDHSNNYRACLLAVVWVIAVSPQHTEAAISEWLAWLSHPSTNEVVVVDNDLEEIALWKQLTLERVHHWIQLLLDYEQPALSLLHSSHSSPPPPTTPSSRPTTCTNLPVPKIKEWCMSTIGSSSTSSSSSSSSWKRDETEERMFYVEQIRQWTCHVEMGGDQQQQQQQQWLFPDIPKVLKKVVEDRITLHQWLIQKSVRELQTVYENMHNALQLSMSDRISPWMHRWRNQADDDEEEGVEETWQWWAFKHPQELVVLQTIWFPDVWFQRYIASFQHRHRQQYPEEKRTMLQEEMASVLRALEQSVRRKQRSFPKVVECIDRMIEAVAVVASSTSSTSSSSSSSWQDMFIRYLPTALVIKNKEYERVLMQWITLKSDWTWEWIQYLLWSLGRCAMQQQASYLTFHDPVWKQWSMECAWLL